MHLDLVSHSLFLRIKILKSIRRRLEQVVKKNGSHYLSIDKTNNERSIGNLFI